MKLMRKNARAVGQLGRLSLQPCQIFHGRSWQTRQSVAQPAEADRKRSKALAEIVVQLVGDTDAFFFVRGNELAGKYAHAVAALPKRFFRKFPVCDFANDAQDPARLSAHHSRLEITLLSVQLQ